MQVKEETQVTKEKRETQKAQAAVGSVLLVEDDAAVRQMTKYMLERIGYRVLAVEGPEPALQICRCGQCFGCLLTDIVMPGMNGVDLAEQVRQLRPGVGIVYMSGYSGDIVAEHGLLEGATLFLSKPFDIASLTEKVEAALRLSQTA